jgi:hypothetical protein
VSKKRMKKARKASWRKKSTHPDKTVTTPRRFWLKPTQAVMSPPPSSEPSRRLVNYAPTDSTCQNSTGTTKHSFQLPTMLPGSSRQTMRLSFHVR